MLSIEELVRCKGLGVWSSGGNKLRQNRSVGMDAMRCEVAVMREHGTSHLRLVNMWLNLYTITAMILVVL